MPIGAIIGGVASIGGAILGSKAQKKAANQAAQAATDNTAANNALAREIYGENKQTLSPFVSTGTQASGAINALLGLGGTAPQVTSAPQANRYSGQYGWNAMADGMPSNRDWMMTTQAPVTTQAAPVNNLQQQNAAFDNFRNSTGYQFRVNEGARALDNSYASRGVGQSGAAAKAALNYGQNIASGEFGNYLNALMAQQGVGLSAAGAQAGVSTNFVNQTTANNNSGASALANAAIAKGNATGNMWQGIAGGIGNIFGSSFG